MTTPFKKPKLEKQQTLQAFFVNRSSGQKTARDVIVIEDQEDFSEVENDPVSEAYCSRGFHLQKVRNSEGEGGSSCGIQPCLVSEHEMLPVLSESEHEILPVLSESEHEILPVLSESEHEMLPVLSESEHEMLPVPCDSLESEPDTNRSIDNVDSSTPPRARKSNDSLKQTHGFEHSWLKEFPWLLYDKEEQSMYCKLCKRYGKLPRNGTGKWVNTGATTLRHNKICKHKTSVMHRDAELCKREEVRSSMSGGIRGALEVVVTQERKSIIGALKCLYYLAKNELAHTTNFSSLIDLYINMGCNYMKELRRGGNASYRSEQVISEFLCTLSDTVKEVVMTKMRDSPTFSLMIDESTDVSVLKQLVVYGRAVVDGKLESHFLGMRDLADGRAMTIERSLLEFWNDNGLEITNMSSFGSDGANVMTGRREGVAARLKRLNSNLISIHCVAHRLALAAGQASETIPYLRKFKEILCNLFYFYHNSAVRQAGLTAIQNVLDDPVLRLKQAKDVRWLSHNAAVEALRRSLSSVLVSLDREASERSNPTASGLLKFMKQFFFVAALSLFADVLPHLAKLSRTLQSSSLDFSILQPVVESCITNVEKQTQSPGKHFSELDDLLASLNEAGHSINVEGNVKERFDEQVRKPYLAKLIENMNKRFQAIGVVSAFSIFNPSELPLMQSEVAHYGETELNILLSQYTDGPLQLNCDDTLSEWKEFRDFLSQQRTSLKTIKDLSEFFLVSTDRKQLFPIMAELIARGLTIPVATADCERGFSAMNRIKTSPRNRLKTKTLEQLMFISIEGPALELFCCSREMGKKKNRRIHWQS